MRPGICPKNEPNDGFLFMAKRKMLASFHSLSHHGFVRSLTTALLLLPHRSVPFANAQSLHSIHQSLIIFAPSPHYAHYVRPNVRLAHRTNHTFGLTVRSLGWKHKGRIGEGKGKGLGIWDMVDMEGGWSVGAEEWLWGRRE